MKNIKICLLIAILLASVCSYGGSNDIALFCRLSDSYFKKYVHNGLVNYQYVQKNSAELKAFHQFIGKIDLSGATKEELKAFFINTYNIIVIYQISQIYPIENPLDEEGFFDMKKHLVAGEQLTLNELEKGKMLKEMKDPRFHFVLACAAMSCPKLANFSYKPGNVEQLLNQRTIDTINSDTFIIVDQKNKKVSLSKIFDWYRNDFGQSNTSLLAYVNKYRKVKIPSDYSVDFYEYDWRLNERK